MNFLTSVENDRQYFRESVIYNVTEDILVAMESLGVTKQELARRISKTKSHVSQMLSGSRNMTVGTLSDVCYALGVELNISIGLDKIQDKEIGVSNKNYKPIHSNGWEFVDNLEGGFIFSFSRKEFGALRVIESKTSEVSWSNSLKEVA